jgi:HEPN domain-containing protein
MKKQAESWLNAACDDLAVVKEICRNDNLKNMTAFHCQQVIEKCFKAVLEEFEGKVPRLHDIITLKERVLPYFEISVDNDIFDQLNELYIDARYPADLGLTPCGKPSPDIALKFCRLAEDVYHAVKEFLRKSDTTYSSQSAPNSASPVMSPSHSLKHCTSTSENIVVS